MKLSTACASLFFVSLVAVEGALAFVDDGSSPELSLTLRELNDDFDARDAEDIVDLSERDPLLFGLAAKVGWNVGKRVFKAVAGRKRDEVDPEDEIASRAFDDVVTELKERGFVEDDSLVDLIMRELDDYDLSERALETDDVDELMMRDLDSSSELD